MAIATLDEAAGRRARTRASASRPGDPVLIAEVAARLDERLDLMKIEPAAVLDAGCGTGVALAGLRTRYMESTVIAVDDVVAELRVWRERSARMADAGLLTRLKLALGAGPRRASAAACELTRMPLAAASVGLVWSCLALQRFTDPLPVIREAHRVLQDGGLFIFASLGPDTLKELRQAFAAADPGNAHVHDFIDMHDLGDMLVEAGFTAPVMEMETLTLTYDDPGALVTDLRTMGWSNARADRRRGLSGRAMWRRVRNRLDGLRVQSRLPASFEIVYGHAWKPRASRRPAAAETPQVVKFYPAWERKPG